MRTFSTRYLGGVQKHSHPLHGQRIERGLVYIFFLSLLSLQYDFARIWIGGLYVPISLLPFMLVAVLWALRLLLTRGVILYPKLLLWASLMFVTSMFLAALGTKEPHFNKILEFSFYLMVPVVLANTITRFYQLRRVLFLLIIVGLIWTVIGYYRIFIEGAAWFGFSALGHSIRRNFDVFAIYGIFLIVVSLLLVQRPKIRLLHIILLCVASLMGLGVVLSTSRASLISVLVGLIVIIYYMPNLRSIAMNVVVLGGIAFGLWMLLPDVAVEHVLQRESSLISLNLEVASPTRYITLRESIAEVARNPFLGVGVGSFSEYIHVSVVDNPNIIVEHAHNAFLNIWIEQGLLGVTSLMILVLYPVVVLIRYARLPWDDSRRWIILGILAVLIAYLIHFLFSSFYTILYFWIIYGIGISCILCIKKEFSSVQTKQKSKVYAA
jgi:O-antigen ligase